MGWFENLMGNQKQNVHSTYNTPMEAAIGAGNTESDMLKNNGIGLNKWNQGFGTKDWEMGSSWEGLQGDQYKYIDPSTNKPMSVTLNSDQISAINGDTPGLAETFGSTGGMLDLGLKGLGALGNIWQARTAAQGLDLAKDKFNWEKGLAAANYGNQAKSYNEELARKANVGLALGGNAVSPEQRASTLANVEANKISPTLKV